MESGLCINKAFYSMVTIVIPVILQVAGALAFLPGPSMSLALSGQRTALFNTPAGCSATRIILGIVTFMIGLVAKPVDIG